MPDLDMTQTLKDSLFQIKGRGIIEKAKQEYPFLNSIDMQYEVTPREKDGYLEFWPSYEMGTKKRPRPKKFEAGKPGVEIYSLKTRPIDVVGDIVSHYLVDRDDRIKEFYRQFEHSLTPQQSARLMKQYQHAVADKDIRETRPYSTWYTQTGLPAYFRGAAFQQWPNPQKLYTPDQISEFDKMMQYLRTKK